MRILGPSSKLGRSTPWFGGLNACSSPCVGSPVLRHASGNDDRDDELAGRLGLVNGGPPGHYQAEQVGFLRTAYDDESPDR